MSSVSQYERHYDVQLLDDLHNYFPAILYDPLRFGTVRDLLMYIQQQMRARFDLFSMGMRSFRAAGAVSAATAPGRMRTGQAAPRGNPPSAATTSSSNSSTPPAAAPAQMPPSALSEVVESLLGLAAATGDGGFINSTGTVPPYNWTIPNSFFSLPTIYTTVRATLQPQGQTQQGDAVVRPTHEEIQSGSILRQVEQAEQVCAICQEDMPVGSQVRNLRSCQHSFHIGCIDTWFLRDVHCPVCRHDIRERRGRPTQQRPQGGSQEENEYDEEAAEDVGL